MPRFEGKIVIVTAGAAGIGFAAARLFAAEGATVAVNDLRADAVETAVAAINTAGGTAIALPGDAADPETVNAHVADVVKRFGRVDVLVNNAGMFSNEWAEDIEFAHWRRMIAVNLDSVFLWSTAVANQSMLANRSGAIVNVASIAGLAAGPKAAAYTTAKHGVVGLTRALAVDWARCGIRVNALCPGLTETEMVAQARAKQPAILAERQNRVPTGQVATPEDQAHAILYLASAEARSTTGLIMNVDGAQIAMNSGYTMPERN